MGKLFANQSGGEGGAMGNPQPSGGARCRGFGSCMGGSCPGNFGGNLGNGGGEPCMGRCNPRKIYTDTYNYLNTNLMQPTVNEVYNDLKSITPGNTVSNNPMAASMGLSAQGKMQGSNAMQGGNGMQGGNTMQRGNAMQGGNPMQGGNFMQGQNAMYGGNTMQGGYSPEGGNAMYGGNAMQAGYSMEGGTPMYRGNAMQIGYSMEGGSAQSGTPNQHNQTMASPMGNQMQGHFGNENTNQRVQKMMGGMGPNILDMMKSGNAKPMSSGGGGGQMPVDGSQSPHSNLNTAGGMYSTDRGMLNNPNQQMFNPTAQYVTGADMNRSGFNPNKQSYNAMNMHQGQRNPNTQQGMANPSMHQVMANSNMQQGITDPTMNQGIANPNIQQGMTNPYMQQGMANSNMQQGMANPNMQQGMTNPNPGQTGNFNPAGQQMSLANRNYGQHSQGIEKFGNLFPGVISGDLGFDPMAIAVQMNPANKKRAAMDQISKLMDGNKANMNNALAGANATTEYFAGKNAANANQQNVPPSNQQIVYGQPGFNATPISQNEQNGGNKNAAATPAYLNQQQVYYENNKTPQQPVYTGAPASNKEQVPLQQQDQYQQQKMVDPNAVAPLSSPVVNQRAEIISAPQQCQGYPTNPTPETQLVIKDPIFPADSSSRPFKPPSFMLRQTFYDFDAFGQPVQRMPSKKLNGSPETNQLHSFQPPSGQLRNNISGHNAKSTVSKTSLMGNRPVGRTPSRSQLQNIYHQYKGSHSNTQQNYRNPASQSGTYSEGQLGAQRATMHQARQAPVETVGGDTAANNQPIHNLPPVNEQPIKQYGDIPAANKPHSEMIPTQVRTIYTILGCVKKFLKT